MRQRPGPGASVNPPVFPLEGGEDGEAPGPRDLIGSEADKTGIQALRSVADVNLLALPELAAYENTEDALTVVSAAQRLAEERRFFLLVDAPSTWVSVDTARAGLAAFDAVRGNHAGLYFPRLRLTDPLHAGGCATFPPSGAVAGRHRAHRRRARRLEGAGRHGGDARRRRGARPSTLTDGENGHAQPARRQLPAHLPGRPATSCGARARCEGADALGVEWKYVPVRRTALFIEESLYRGTQWVVFEPNDEPLWAQIRLERRRVHARPVPPGRVPGHARRARRTSSSATTRPTTPDDINRGIVNILVGFAPLKPAEFVVIKIQQTRPASVAGP